MVDENSPYSVGSQDGAMKLDSTKRCLFPAESESPISRMRSEKRRSEMTRSVEIESPLDEIDQNSAHETAEESRKSPISVVSVLSGGDFNSKHTKNPDVASSHAKGTLSCDTVFEEQTEIEVEYFESGDINYAEDVSADLDLESDETTDENNPERDMNIEAVANQVKRSPSDLRNLRAKPLLDSERTPSRSQKKSRRKQQMRTPIFGCVGKSCVSVCDDSSHKLVERTITGFLEDTSVKTTPEALKTSCHDWQDWSYFGFGRKEPSKYEFEQSPSKENIRNVLRRRTSHSLQSRKKNVRRLKQNLAPFAPSPARSPARASSLFRNRSFSIQDHRSAIVRVSKDKKQSRGRFTTDVLELCTMYESVALESPEIMRNKLDRDDDDNLSYDSDPEDFTRRRLSTTEAGSVVSATPKPHNQMSFPSPSRSFIDVNNDEAFANIVQEIFNKTTTLVLHPLQDPNKPTSVQASRPMAVDAWLERGQHLAYALIQPKWIWKAKDQANTRENFCLQGIELLDITKILKMEETDRCSESFGKPSHCFYVKSIYDDEFCFEAKSRSERNRIVNSLKLLIARFGAKVLTGDAQVYYEFFWTTEGAPGKAPNLREVFEVEPEYAEA